MLRWKVCLAQAFLRQEELVATKSRDYRCAIIGDVHGYRAALQELMLQFDAYGVDRVISLGDLIDRGPEGAACVRLVRTRGFLARDRVRRPIEMVLGNHEDRLLRTWRGEPIPGQSSPPKPWSPETYTALSHEDFDWLNTCPYMIRFQEYGLDICAVHGGFIASDLTPGWYSRDRSGLLCRTGFLDEKNGDRLSPMQRSARLWADEYDGRFGRVVYGHTSFPKPRYSLHAVGIDGSKHGRLRGVVVSAGEPDAVFEVNVGS